jgi:hypothetical protein
MSATAERFYGGIEAYRVRTPPGVVGSNSAGAVHSPVVVALLADARAVVLHHRPADGLLGPCSGCGLGWPCRPYCRARRVLREFGQPRPVAVERDS